MKTTEFKKNLHCHTNPKSCGSCACKHVVPFNVARGNPFSMHACYQVICGGRALFQFKAYPAISAAVQAITLHLEITRGLVVSRLDVTKFYTLDL